MADNPLVAQEEQAPDGPGPLTAGTGDRGWGTGIGIAESVMDVKDLDDGSSWVESGLAYGGMAMEAVSLAVDPIGTLLSYGVSWLIEHVQPLQEALDWFAGDPDGVAAYGETWANVSQAVAEASTRYENAVSSDTAEWTGDAGDAYRKHAAERGEALSGASELASTISSVVTIMGEVVSFVREFVRDLVADCVSRLITYALEAVCTLGLGTPVIVAQATTFISKTVTEITEMVQKLTKTISNVAPKLSRMVEVFGEIMEALGKLGRKAGDKVGDINKWIDEGQGLGAKAAKAAKFVATGGGDTADNFAEGAWKKVDDIFGTDVVGKHDAKFGAPDIGSGAGGANGSSGADGSSGSSIPSDSDSGGGSGSGGSSSSGSGDASGSSTSNGSSGAGSSPDADDGGSGSGGSGPGDDSGGDAGGAGSGSATASSSPGSAGSAPSPSSGPSDAQSADSGGATPQGGGSSPSTSHADTGSPAGGTGPDASGSGTGDSGIPPQQSAPASGSSTPGSGPGDTSGNPAGSPSAGVGSGGTGGGPAPGPSGGSPSGPPGSAAPSTPEGPSQTSAQTSAAAPPGPEAPAGPAPSAPRPDQSASGGQTGGGVAGAGPMGGGGTPSSPSSSRPGSGGGWTGTPGSPGAAGRPPGGPDGTPRPRGPEASPRGPRPATSQRPDTPSPRPDGNNPQRPPRPGDQGPEPQRPGPRGPGHPPNGPATQRPNGPGGNPPVASPRTAGAHPNAPRPNGPGGPAGQRPDAPGARPDAPGHRSAGAHPDAPHPTSPSARADAPARQQPPGHRPDAPSPQRPATPDGPQRPKDADPADEPEGAPQRPKDTDGDAEPGTPERQRQIDEAEAHRQTTDSGSSYHDDPNMQELARRVPDDGVHHTVDAHSLPDGRVRIGDRTFSADEFADVLRRDPDWDGKPIRLLSCDAGDSGLARRLSEELGVPVTAPRGLAWTDGNGRVFSSDMGPDGKPGWPPNGGWDTHHPDGTRTPASNDGFHPSRDGADPGQRPEDAEERGKRKHADTTDVKESKKTIRADHPDAVLDGQGRPVNQDGVPLTRVPKPVEVVENPPEFDGTDNPQSDREYKVEPGASSHQFVDYDRPQYSSFEREITVPADEVGTNADTPPPGRPREDPDPVPPSLSDVRPLAENAIYHVQHPNGLRTTFFTDGSGVVKWVEADSGAIEHPDTFGTQGRGFNPDLSYPLLPDVKYAVGERHTTPSHPDGMRTHQWNFQTDSHAQTVAMTGTPEFRGSDDNFRHGGAQHRAGHEGQAADPNSKWAGGHLAANEMGGPGEYINMFGQMHGSNSGTYDDGWNNEASWRAQEQQLGRFDAHPNHAITEYQVQMTRNADGIPESVTMRWREVDYDDQGNVIAERIKERDFPNVRNKVNYHP